MHEQESPRRIAGAVTTAASMTYCEMEPTLRAQLARLRLRNVAGAADALADLDARGWRSRVVRRIVERLAGDMAIEIAANPLPCPRLTLVPDDP